jgi:acyl-CoA reductase-like NAD-dependent aldehyde dehydrogenase
MSLAPNSTAFSDTEQTTISPHTQQPFVTRVYPSADALAASIDRAAAAQAAWRRVPLQERIAVGRRFIVRDTLL